VDAHDDDAAHIVDGAVLLGCRRDTDDDGYGSGESSSSSGDSDPDTDSDVDDV